MKCRWIGEVMMGFLSIQQCASWRSSWNSNEVIEALLYIVVVLSEPLVLH